MHERGRSPGAKKAVRPAGGVFLHLVGLGGLLVVSTLAGACATAPTKGVDVAQQEHLLIGLRAQNATYVRQIEELQNRIFILEDRLDSRRVAAERRAAPELPPAVVVTLTRRSHVVGASLAAAATPAGVSSPGPLVPAQASDSSTPDASSPAAHGASPEGGSTFAEDEERPCTRAERRATAREARKLAAQRRLEEKRALAAAAREARARKIAQDHELVVASPSPARQGSASEEEAAGRPAASGAAAAPVSPLLPRPSSASSPAPASAALPRGRAVSAAAVPAGKPAAPANEADGRAVPPESDPDEVEIPEGPYLSIETPVEYVGEAALGANVAEGARAVRRDKVVRP